MNATKFAAAASLAVAALFPLPLAAQSDVPLSVTEVVAAPDALSPFAAAVSIPVSGDYTLTVTDFGDAAGPVTPATRIDAWLITEAASVPLSLTAAGSGTAALPAGPATLALIAVPEPGGRASIGITLGVAGEAALVETVVAFDAVLPPDNPTALDREFTAPQADDYRIALSDFGFPDPLDGLQALVVDADSSTVLGLISAGDTLDVTLAAGQRVSFGIIATRSDADDRAEFSLEVMALATNTVALTSVDALGVFDEVVRIPLEDLPVGETVTATLTGFPLPTPLTDLRAQVRAGGDVLATVPANDSADFTPTLPDAELLLVAAPGETGAAGVRLADTATTLFEDVVLIEPAASAQGVATLNAEFEALTTGSVELTVSDFAFPTAFDAVDVIVVRDGTEVGRLPAAGFLAIDVVPGTYQVGVAASIGGGGSGFLGLSVVDDQGRRLLDATATADGALAQETISLSDPLELVIAVTDLGIPAAFTSLSAIVTRGADSAGQIFGAGAFDVELEAGVYTLSIVVEPDATAGYGSFVASATERPAMPTLSLSASADAVAAGGSVTLTWESDNAAGCVASGDWSGDRGTNGSETISGIDTDRTFLLDCSGPGGDVSASVSVRATAAESVSGGGAFGLSGLAALLLISLRSRMRPVQRP